MYFSYTVIYPYYTRKGRGKPPSLHNRYNRAFGVSSGCFITAKAKIPSSNIEGIARLLTIAVQGPSRSRLSFLHLAGGETWRRLTRCSSQAIRCYSAPGGIRTHDLWLKRPLLYQLSYRSVFVERMVNRHSLLRIIPPADCVT